MKRIVSILLMAACGATAGAASLPAYIVTKAARGKDLLVVSRQRAAVTVQLPEQLRGTVQIPIDDIRSITFSLPSVANRATSAFEQRKWSEAQALFKAALAPYTAFLDLPNNNIVPLMWQYAESFRLDGKYDEAIALYQQFDALPSGLHKQRAQLGRAYCDCAMGRTKEARALVDSAAPTNHAEALFAQAQMVRARISLSEGNPLQAVDEIARAVATMRIESDVYPECLFVSAACYEALESIRKEQPAVKDPFGESDARYGSAKVVLPEAMANLLQVASGIHQQVTNMFPGTVWADQSRAELARLSEELSKAKNETPETAHNESAVETEEKRE